MSPQRHILFYKVFFDKKNSKPLGKYLLHELFNSFIFSDPALKMLDWKSFYCGDCIPIISKPYRVLKWVEIYTTLKYIYICLIYTVFFFFWRNGIVRHLITFSNRSIISESASNTPVNIIFQISINNHTEELCPGGSQKNVTKENVLDYVRYCASVSLFYHSYEWRELNFISSIIVSL